MISFGLIKNKKNYETRADLFNFLIILITLLFFIFILRSQNSFGEPRWYFPLLFSSLICVGRASTFFYNVLKNQHKKLAIIILIVMVVFGGYYQVKHADFIIDIKIDSYFGIKEAGLFLKENSFDKNSLVIVAAQPQMAYYSELEVIHPVSFSGWDGTNEDSPFEDFIIALEDTPNAKYVVVTFSEPGQPSWMAQSTYVQENSGKAFQVWEIPFTNTKVNFGTGEQDIKQSIAYENIKFKLLAIKQEVFIYEISRTK